MPYSKSIQQRVSKTGQAVGKDHQTEVNAIPILKEQIVLQIGTKLCYHEQKHNFGALRLMLRILTRAEHLRHYVLKYKIGGIYK